MAGHSKWAQIKRQKAANDAKRGQLYTKLGREITVAARDGGGDPETNFRLRLAVQRAKDANMPADTIERAVKRGSGELDDGVRLEDINYEGYGPGGAALFIEALTDNRNRTVAELRNVLTRGGGNLGESGSVAWMFDTRGQVLIELNGGDPDEAMLESIELGCGGRPRRGRHARRSHAYRAARSRSTRFGGARLLRGERGTHPRAEDYV